MLNCFTHQNQGRLGVLWSLGWMSRRVQYYNICTHVKRYGKEQQKKQKVEDTKGMNPCV